MKAAERIKMLTARDGHVMGLVVRGFPNKAIAADLGVSVATVKNTLSHIFITLGVRDRASAAVVYALGIRGIE
jgi:DNA-binding NarL/FixJ family response regulator